MCMKWTLYGNDEITEIFLVSCIYLSVDSNKIFNKIFLISALIKFVTKCDIQKFSCVVLLKLLEEN